MGTNSAERLGKYVNNINALAVRALRRQAEAASCVKAAHGDEYTDDRECDCAACDDLRAADALVDRCAHEQYVIADLMRRCTSPYVQIFGEKKPMSFGLAHELMEKLHAEHDAS